MSTALIDAPIDQSKESLLADELINNDAADSSAAATNEKTLSLGNQLVGSSGSGSARAKLAWQAASIVAISAAVLKLSAAWSLATYLAAVVGLVLLYWSYDPRQERRAETNRSKSGARKNQSNISDRRLRPDNALFATLGVTCDDFLQFQAITDRFGSFQEIVEACRATQLESFNLIVAVDFSASNEWQGRRTFHGKPLHKITTTAVSGILGSSVSKQWNPYQKVIGVLDQTLTAFLPPGAGVYGLGFGHDPAAPGAPTSSVFNLASECGIAQFAGRAQFRSLRDLLTAYNKLAASVPLGGPTDLSGVIRRSVDLLLQSGSTYHVLVIVTDGQLSGNPQDSIDAIVDASDYPLSIVVIGVGDGPFHDMCEFDDSLVRRKFDNFQFVDYHRVTAKAKNPEQSLALHCLMEIPDQYKSIVRQGYLKHR